MVESEWISNRLCFWLMLFKNADLDIICFILLRFICIDFLEFSVNNIFIWWGYDVYFIIILSI